jgi:hypothetical protein
MQIRGEIPEAAFYAGMIIGIDYGLAPLTARSVAHRTSPLRIALPAVTVVDVEDMVVGRKW